jgi:hypothetical protein
MTKPASRWNPNGLSDEQILEKLLAFNLPRADKAKP